MLFRKYAKRSGRMKETDLIDDNHGLLEKLRLYEGSYLKRAAALLFHPDPEKYVTGAFVKIGFFREGMDLVYQDEVHGNLFQQVVKLMDLLCTKYMKAIITYEGIQRIETLPMPREALREALLNACINKDYAEPSPIQIRVYENVLKIINGGVLPERWTVETLLSPRRSSAMTLRVYGQLLSLSTRKGLLPKATRTRPKRLPQRLPRRPYKN